MAISMDLRVLARKLEKNSDDILINASNKGPEVLKKVATAIAAASTLLEGVADDMDQDAGFEITPQQLDEIAALASAFDASNDPLLKKQASMLDDLLLTIAAPKNAVAMARKTTEDEINRLRAERRKALGESVYTEAHESLQKMENAKEQAKAVEQQVKRYSPLEAPLSTRSPPDRPGGQMTRITDGVYQDIVTGIIYDYSAGYTTQKGNKIPGGSVANQTLEFGDVRNQGTSIFQTRESLMNRYAGDETVQKAAEALKAVRDLAPGLLDRAIDKAREDGLSTSQVAEILASDIKDDSLKALADEIDKKKINYGVPQPLTNEESEREFHNARVLLPVLKASGWYNLIDDLFTALYNSGVHPRHLDLLNSMFRNADELATTISPSKPSITIKRQPISKEEEEGITLLAPSDLISLNPTDPETLPIPGKNAREDLKSLTKLESVVKEAIAPVLDLGKLTDPASVTKPENVQVLVPTEDDEEESSLTKEKMHELVSVVARNIQSVMDDPSQESFLKRRFSGKDLLDRITWKEIQKYQDMMGELMFSEFGNQVMQFVKTMAEFGAYKDVVPAAKVQEISTPANIPAPVIPSVPNILSKPQITPVEDFEGWFETYQDASAKAEQIIREKYIDATRDQQEKVFYEEIDKELHNKGFVGSQDTNHEGITYLGVADEILGAKERKLKLGPWNPKALEQALPRLKDESEEAYKARQLRSKIEAPSIDKLQMGALVPSDLPTSVKNLPSEVMEMVQDMLAEGEDNELIVKVLSKLLRSGKYKGFTILPTVDDIQKTKAYLSAMKSDIKTLSETGASDTKPAENSSKVKNLRWQDYQNKWGVLITEQQAKELENEIVSRYSKAMYNYEQAFKDFDYDLENLPASIATLPTEVGNKVQDMLLRGESSPAVLSMLRKLLNISFIEKSIKESNLPDDKKDALKAQSLELFKSSSISDVRKFLSENKVQFIQKDPIFNIPDYNDIRAARNQLLGPLKKEELNKYRKAVKAQVFANITNEVFTEAGLENQMFDVPSISVSEVFDKINSIMGENRAKQPFFHPIPTNEDGDKLIPFWEKPAEYWRAFATAQELYPKGKGLPLADDTRKKQDKFMTDQGFVSPDDYLFGYNTSRMMLRNLDPKSTGNILPNYGKYKTLFSDPEEYRNAFIESKSLFSVPKQEMPNEWNEITGSNESDIEDIPRLVKNLILNKITKHVPRNKVEEFAEQQGIDSTVVDRLYEYSKNSGDKIRSALMAKAYSGIPFDQARKEIEKEYSSVANIKMPWDVIESVYNMLQEHKEDTEANQKKQDEWMESRGFYPPNQIAVGGLGQGKERSSKSKFQRFEKPVTFSSIILPRRAKGIPRDAGPSEIENAFSEWQKRPAPVQQKTRIQSPKLQREPPRQPGTAPTLPTRRRGNWTS